VKLFQVDIKLFYEMDHEIRQHGATISIKEPIERTSHTVVVEQVYLSTLKPE